MLDVEILDRSEVERAAAVFHRDGFVPIGDALDPEELAFAQSGAARVIARQMAETPLEQANRGHARYSFGPQLHHPEWVQLVELATVLPILEAIWGSRDFICSGGGGDYSAPGAKEQHLHADMGDPLKDPLNQVTIHDVPTPYIVVNFLMVDFRKSQRRHPVRARDPPDAAAGSRPGGGTGPNEGVHPLRPRRNGHHPGRALLARRHRQRLR